MTTAKSVDEYIASFQGLAKERLEQIRQLIHAEIPSAEERISYGIIGFFVDGKLIVYVAGYDKHIGLYPGRTNSAAYNKLAAKYAYGKSTARFSHSEPLPVDIIREFIRVRLKEAGIKP